MPPDTSERTTRRQAGWTTTTGAALTATLAGSATKSAKSGRHNSDNGAHPPHRPESRTGTRPAHPHATERRCGGDCAARVPETTQRLINGDHCEKLRSPITAMTAPSDPLGVGSLSPAREGATTNEGLRLSDLLGALSLTTDLGAGVPFEKGLRTCVVASELAGELGLGRMIGRLCTSRRCCDRSAARRTARRSPSCSTMTSPSSAS